MTMTTTPTTPAPTGWFSRTELSAIYQALFVAEQYYGDPAASVANMHLLDAAGRAKRLAEMAPVFDKISAIAKAYS
jgi:hypothetical protein